MAITSHKQFDYKLNFISKEVTVEELNVEESETLKAAIDRLIGDMNLPPNVQLRKEMVESTDGQKKTKSKLL